MVDVEDTTIPPIRRGSCLLRGLIILAALFLIVGLLLTALGEPLSSKFVEIVNVEDLPEGI